MYSDTENFNSKITKDKKTSIKKTNEEPKIEYITEQLVEKNHVPNELSEPVSAQLKVKKPRKQMTLEHIQILTERLAKGREINLLKKAEQKQLSDARKDALIKLKYEQLKNKEEKFKESINLDNTPTQPPSPVPPTPTPPTPPTPPAAPVAISKPKRAKKVKAEPVVKPIENKPIRILFY